METAAVPSREGTAPGPLSLGQKLLLGGLCAAVAGVSLYLRWQLTVGLVGAICIGWLTFSFYEQLWMFMLVALAFSIEVSSQPGKVGVLSVPLPTEGVIPLVFFAIVIAAFVRGRIQWPRSSLNLPILIFFGAILLSIFSATEPLYVIKAWVRDAAYCFAGFYMLPQVLTERRRIVRLLVAVLAAHVAMALYGMYTQAVAGIRIYQDVARPFFPEHCAYAALLSMTFAVALAFYLNYWRGWQAAWGLAALLILGAAILLSFVRGAWLSLAAMLLFYAWTFRSRINYRVVFWSIIFLLLMVGLVSWFELWPQLEQRFFTIADTGYLTNYDRIDRWMSAIQMFLDHPWLGVGWGTYADHYHEYTYFRNAFSVNFHMGAHNQYLQILAEAGLVGMLAYLWLLRRFFTNGMRQLRREPDRFRRAWLVGTLGAMITFLVHSVVNNLGPSDKIFVTFWVLFGCLPAIQLLREKERKTF